MFNKRENFEVIPLVILVVILLVITGLLAFHYYVVKTLGFRNYVILIGVLAVISSIYGYTTNCLK